MSDDSQTLAYLVEEIATLREQVKELNERFDGQEEERERAASLQENASLKEEDHYWQLQQQQQQHSEESAQEQAHQGGNKKQHTQNHASATPAVVSSPAADPAALTDEKFVLPEDVFTMFFFARYGSESFFYALVVYAMQLVSLSIIVYDLLDDDLRAGDEDGNPFNVPIQVEVQVQVSRCMAILISVVSRDDCLDTFRIVTVGYKSRWKSIFEGGTRLQFVLMNLMRFSEGVFVIFISFIFIVQSDNVLDLFLNFAAIEFISDLDNLAYELAGQGWICESMQTLTELISETEIFLTIKDKDKLRNKKYMKHFLIIFLLSAMYAGFFAILRAERKGLLLRSIACSHVRVEFGEQQFDYANQQEANNNFTGFQYDPININAWKNHSFKAVTIRGGSTRPVDKEAFLNGGNQAAPILIYSDFSNDYIARDEGTSYGRYIYDETGYDDITSGMFYYCEEEKSWVFTIRALAIYNAVPQDTIDRCGEHGWLLRSPVTDAFSLDEVPLEGWTVWTGTLVDATDVEIYCSNCNTDIDCGIQRGECIHELCECEEKFTGTFCEREKGCDTVAKYVQGEVNVMHASNLTAYDRPVYLREVGNNKSTSDELKREYEFLIYAGRRWVVIKINGRHLALFAQDIESITDPKFAHRFAERFHAYWFDLRGGEKLKRISEETDVQVPTGNLQWFTFGLSNARGDYGIYGYTIPYVQGIECLPVDCANTTVCGDQGTCTSVDNNISLFGGLCPTGIQGRQCICNETTTYTGHYCEYANSVKFDEKDGTVVTTTGPFQMDPYLTPCYVLPYKDRYKTLSDCLETLYPDYVTPPFGRTESISDNCPFINV